MYVEDFRLHSVQVEGQDLNAWQLLRSGATAFCTVSTSGNGTYDHLHRDRDGAVECWVSTIFGHHCQVYHPVGNLLIVQRLGHADHCREGRRRQTLFAFTEILQVAFNNSRCDPNILKELCMVQRTLRYLRSPPP